MQTASPTSLQLYLYSIDLVATILFNNCLFERDTPLLVHGIDHLHFHNIMLILFQITTYSGYFDEAQLPASFYY